ncbi:MAG TPA: tRNA (adenosine(37)-N6)-threonylcarbamoyltransferase complex dimerization subunit type 1 TsaB [Thermoanaerobaculia bacterium]|nr:tRNA (adenosine(37)-N6)-threonylcarbamoyltransferase complex dimerization subunit type 1 TsaB [Thermoanaerobaculia bacterium]
MGAAAEVSATEVDELILAIDTGSPLVSVALGRRGSPAAARAVAVERSSRQLLALVAEVLDELGARPADLGGVVALRGPGGFTGLRVGLATALGFHQALGIKALALPTLLTQAAWWSAAGAPEALPAAGPPDVIISAVDALRGEWSAQAFAPGLFPRALCEMALAAGDELARLAPSRPAGAHLAAPAGADLAAPAGASPAGQIVVVGFGVSRLARPAPPVPGVPAEGLGPAAVRYVEPGPLAPVALRLAAAMPANAWQAAELTSPIYSRPPAITTPKPRRHPAPGPASDLTPGPAERKADGG